MRLGGAGARVGTKRKDEIALGQAVSNADGDPVHDAGVWRGDLHGRLVALERQQGLVDLDPVPGGDQDLDHGHVGEVADVGQDHRDDFTVRPARRTRSGRLGRGGRTGGGFLDRRPRRLGLGLQGQQRGSLADPIADLDLELPDQTAARRRDLHGRLVALQGEQRLLGLDPVPGRDQDLDDLDVGEVPDVGQQDVFDGCHALSSWACGAGCVRPIPDWAFPGRFGTCEWPWRPFPRGSPRRPRVPSGRRPRRSSG